MDKIFIARVIAHHEFGKIVWECAFANIFNASVSAEEAIEEFKAKDWEWANSYGVEISEMEFVG